MNPASPSSSPLPLLLLLSRFSFIFMPLFFVDTNREMEGTQLNSDTLHLIFALLSEGDDLARAGMVCKAWHDASLDDAHWRRIAFAQQNHWALIPTNNARFGSYRAFFRFFFTPLLSSTPLPPLSLSL